MFNGELFKQIISLAGPLGPLGSEEDVSKIRQKITRDHPLATAMDLLNIIRIAPTIPESVSWDDVRWEIVELLAMLAEDDQVRNFLLSSLLTSSKARSVILDSLALLSSPESGPTLARLASRLSKEDNISDEEFIALASALGSSGGPEALMALNDMHQMSELSKEVKKEINIALTMLRNQETK
jgi:hypothetical protein